MCSFPVTRCQVGRNLAALIVALIVVLSVVPAQAAAPLPNSMVAFGDSITRGFNTGQIIFTDAIENSWSTGTTPAVNSLYLRILAQNPAIRLKNFNLAKTGARMSDLNGQADVGVLLHPDYISILMGANDVCRSSEAAMTSVQAFHDQFLAVMSRLQAQAPQARVYVLSIPDVYQLWSILKDNPSARAIWSGLQICQAMLVNPTSLQPADVDRRARVRQRNIDFNTQLRLVCAQFVQCRFDDNAIFNATFLPADITTRDYFHPSLSGQTKLAAAAWAMSGLAP
jgi:lysophospholipase L1-like esterase